jgi:hypothetical protein
MEKHAAYCAMIRLGLKVPPTVLVPHKNPPDNARFQYTATRYNLPFDLGAIAEKIGYPLFMKPYDGGQWIGVSRILDREDLNRAYDASGRRLMHLQASVEGYDIFARSLSIGPETMVMKFRPELPMHERYAVAHDFLSSGVGQELLTISRLVNAFFRWEFNSCECLVRGDQVHPIDYANASPDVALTSLHYYFPPPASTGCSSRPSGPPTRRTSTSGSYSTCAASSASGCARTSGSPRGRADRRPATRSRTLPRSPRGSLSSPPTRSRR